MRVLGDWCRFCWIVNQTWRQNLAAARNYRPRHSVVVPNFMSAWNLP